LQQGLAAAFPMTTTSTSARLSGECQIADAGVLECVYDHCGVICCVIHMQGAPLLRLHLIMRQPLSGALQPPSASPPTAPDAAYVFLVPLTSLQRILVYCTRSCCSAAVGSSLTQLASDHEAAFERRFAATFPIATTPSGLDPQTLAQVSKAALSNTLGR
jgi:hypothetical protein